MTTSHKQSTRYHSKQLKLFEVKSRIQNMIDRIESEPEKGNVVRAKIPKIAHLCRDIVPNYFRDEI